MCPLHKNDQRIFTLFTSFKGNVLYDNYNLFLIIKQFKLSDYSNDSTNR